MREADVELRLEVKGEDKLRHVCPAHQRLSSVKSCFTLVTDSRCLIWLAADKGQEETSVSCNVSVALIME